LKARKLTAKDLKVKVTAEKGTHPARLTSFYIDVTVPSMDDRHQEGLLRAVKSCLIHNTLLGEPNINIAINTAVLAQA
jgi:uncharacterized OsmC-like protein